MAFWSAYPPYVSAAEKRARAAAAVKLLTRQAGKKGRRPEPIVLEGRKIATTFWGRAWCDNLESYADFAYRLERGRSYVRSGAVVDLRIAAGKIEARVSGSELYQVAISIARLRAPRWKAIAARCGGAVGGLVSLLRGKLPDQVMSAVTDRKAGLFPDPRHIEMSCTCPDAASVCKHVAASLYGVGARLDARPELLFELRGVDPQDLIQQAAQELVGAARGASPAMPDGGDLGALFGIELAAEAAPARPKKVRKPRLKARPRPGKERAP
jgi:uncharacterized Zn finger protein